jgi:hypothetical protein
VSISLGERNSSLSGVLLRTLPVTASMTTVRVPAASAVVLSLTGTW